MNVTRFADAPPYEAPLHHGMSCLRLQGHNAGPAEQLWLGVSIVEPGGHTALTPSPMEKHYIVLDGELTLIGQRGNAAPEEVLLGPLDSCRFAPGEARQIVNRGTRPARVLLAMPLHPPVPPSSPAEAN